MWPEFLFVYKFRLFTWIDSKKGIITMKYYNVDFTHSITILTLNPFIISNIFLFLFWNLSMLFNTWLFNKNKWFFVLFLEKKTLLTYIHTHTLISISYFFIVKLFHSFINSLYKSKISNDKFKPLDSGNWMNSHNWREKRFVQCFPMTKAIN